MLTEQVFLNYSSIQLGIEVEHTDLTKNYEFSYCHEKTLSLNIQLNSCKICPITKNVGANTLQRIISGLDTYSNRKHLLNIYHCAKCSAGIGLCIHFSCCLAYGCSQLHSQGQVL